MMRNGFGAKYQHPMLLAAASAPLAVLLAAALHPASLKGLPVLPMVWVVLCWSCLLMPGRWRMPAAVASVLALAGIALVVLPIREAWALLLLPAGYGALLFALLPVAGWTREQELPPYCVAAGGAAHLLLHLAAGYAARMGSGLYKPAEGFRMVAFVAFVVLALLALNRASLWRAAQERVTVPVRMRRQNVALTLGLLALALLLAALPAIGALLKELWLALWRSMAAAAAWIASLLQTGGAGLGGGEASLPGGFEGGAAAEPGLLEQIIEKLLGAIAVVAVAALAVFIGRKLLRLLRRLFAWLRQRFSRYGNAAVKDYVDEVTDTRDGAAYEPSGLMRRMRETMYRRDESRMTPAQRVRYRYLRLRLKHGEWKAADTARDTLPPAAAQLYERVRYGAQPLTGEEAQQFRQDTQKL